MFAIHVMCHPWIPHACSMQGMLFGAAAVAAGTGLSAKLPAANHLLDGIYA
jgi:hypothetical protein